MSQKKPDYSFNSCLEIAAADFIADNFYTKYKCTNTIQTSFPLNIKDDFSSISK